MSFSEERYRFAIVMSVAQHKTAIFIWCNVVANRERLSLP
jgi:hypothetical protein